MSMISELVKELRRADNPVGGYYRTLYARAADTIEELSAKLATANMERSTAYHNNGWIPCSSGRMPENGQTVVVTIGPTDTYRHMAVLIYYKTKPERFTDNDWQGKGFYHYIWGDWVKRDNVIAWMPTEPYKGGGVDE